MLPGPEPAMDTKEERGRTVDGVCEDASRRAVPLEKTGVRLCAIRVQKFVCAPLQFIQYSHGASLRKQDFLTWRSFLALLTTFWLPVQCKSSENRGKSAVSGIFLRTKSQILGVVS